MSQPEQLIIDASIHHFSGENQMFLDLYVQFLHPHNMPTIKKKIESIILKKV